MFTRVYNVNSVVGLRRHYLVALMLATVYHRECGRQSNAMHFANELIYAPVVDSLILAAHPVILSRVDWRHPNYECCLCRNISGIEEAAEAGNAPVMLNLEMCRTVTLSNRKL